VDSIKALGGRQLLWVPVRNTVDHHELRDGDEVIGHLDWEGSGRAAGEMAGQRWTFKREGLLGSRVTIRVPGTEGVLGEFRSTWKGGGTLNLGPGLQLGLKPGNFWRTRYEWVDIPDIPLVRLKNRGGWKCQVEIEADATASPQLRLLVVLGWFLLLSWRQDAAISGG
jgi:hypothetical protein